MNKVFTDNGWKDYVYWQTEDQENIKEDKQSNRRYMQKWE